VDRLSCRYLYRNWLTGDEPLTIAPHAHPYWQIEFVLAGRVVARAGADTQVLGRLVLDGEVQPGMAGLCVRALAGEGGGWNSVYCAVPLLTPELMRSLARFAGVHVYRDSNDILYADRQFVAVHTGATPATDELRLPAVSDVYDVFGRRVVATGVTSFTLDVPAYSTVLYYLGDAQAFARAVEATGR